MSNFEQIRKAAEQGDIDAQAELGSLYRFGEDGVRQNYREAFKWYSIAAERGHMFAQTYLGLMYALGQGIPKDRDKAIKWLLIAARQGSPHALSALQELNSPNYARTNEEYIKKRPNGCASSLIICVSTLLTLGVVGLLLAG